MRTMVWAAVAVSWMQALSAENLRMDLGTGVADQQGAQAGAGAQLAATWWAHPRIGIEFALGRGFGHDGDNGIPSPFDFVGDVWVDRYTGLGVRHRFATKAGNWQPFVRAGLARVHGIAEIQVLQTIFNPLDPDSASTSLYEFEATLRDTSPYIGFGATRKLGDLELSLQVQHLAVDFGESLEGERTELLIGLGWSL